MAEGGSIAAAIAPLRGGGEGRQLSRSPTSHLLKRTPCKSSTPSPTCAQCSPARTQDRACAHDGQPARGPPRPGREARAARRSGGGHDLRQPPAVPAARGLRPATRARSSAIAPSCSRPPAATSCSRPTSSELYPEPQTFKVRRRPTRRPARRRVPPRLFHRRVHGGDEAVPLRAAARGRVRQEGLPAADGDQGAWRASSRCPPR